jgi:uncharacterized protein YciI
MENEIIKLKEQLKESEHQKSCLMHYINDAVVKVGIYKPDAIIYGPQYLLACEDLVDYCLHLQKENERLQAIITSWEGSKTEETVDEENQRVINEIDAQLYEEMQDAIDPYVEARLLPNSVIQAWEVIFEYWKSGLLGGREK